jgi:hypothetical protein
MESSEREQDTTPEQEAAEAKRDEAADGSGPTTADIAGAGTAEGAEGSDQIGNEEERERADDRPQPSVDERTPLLDDDAAAEFRGRWEKTQAAFVDDPRSAVASADALVAELMKRLAEEFARERSGLEKQWSESGEASTEDLRLALQRYRSFFSRLLSL